MRRLLIAAFLLCGSPALAQIPTGGAGVGNKSISPVDSHHFHGGMGYYENETAQTIDSVSWHMVYTAGEWITGAHLNEVSYQDGASDIVLGAFADGGGSPNEVIVDFDAAHPFAVDEIVSISGSTNYNDIFEVQSATETTINIVSAFAAEGADGQAVTRGGNLTIAKPGLYWLMYHSSVASANAADSVDVKIYAGTLNGVPVPLDMSESRHNAQQPGLFSTPPGCEIFAASAGDVVALAVKNTSGANNVLFRYIHVMVVQL